MTHQQGGPVKGAAVALAISLLGSGCTETVPRTELIVVVDTDLSVPGEITAIHIFAESPTEAERSAIADPLSREQLPVTVGLVHREGPLGPFEVRVTGVRGGRLEIERRARFSFVPELTAAIELPLLRGCLGVDCAEGETCAAEGCRSEDVEPGELLAWTGAPPRIGGDGGSDGDGEGDGDGDGDADADGCVATEEECNGEDDDCDGLVDEDFDLRNDEEHCGDCDTSCEPWQRCRNWECR